MKRAVVTGASSGIGAAVARRFAADGFAVCVNARRKEQLDLLAKELPGDGHIVCAGDLGDPATASRIAECVGERWGGCEALIHSAGVFRPAGVVDSPLADWRFPFDLMVNGAAHLVRALVPLLSDGGRVILVTSIHGERVEAGGSSYGMAKAALNQYARSLALELAPRRILVNAIAPGFVDTPMSVVNGVNELESEWFRSNYVNGQRLPLKRAGRPEEIAGVAAFLAGSDATYVTGQIITVDGGLTITF